MAATEHDHAFDALLDYLKRSRGFDFSGYKRPSLMRRVSRRMQSAGVESYSDYLDFLQVHPDEFMHLFNTILINVTKFFRDEGAWDYIKTGIIPQIIGRKKPAELIRVWCAGTASGEEAYSVAMLLTGALGEEQFKERVKIYATDLDEEALSQARTGSYSTKQVEGISPELLARNFEQNDGRYVFRKDLRRAVIFGRHDLLQDAPISRVDLLICRNTLMYFNAEAQAKILIHFHFALADDGILFLGKSEMLLTHTSIFTPLDMRRRVFTKVPRLNLRDRLMLLAHTDNDEGVNDEGINHVANHIRAREAAFEFGPAAQIVVDQASQVILVNQKARALFGLQTNDLGRPLKDLEISYKPIELRSRIEQAFAERHMVTVRAVEWPAATGDLLQLDLNIMPLISNRGVLLGASVTFLDVRHVQHLQSELLNARQELETTYEELQSTVEELETSNEELQSTNEELETLNEELQSTNEELETMNEELQSTNEELETMNEEMRMRTIELDQVNGFLESILTSLRAGVIVVDHNLRVQIWNGHAEDLWGVRADETERQHFLNLDIGLPVDELKQPIRACLLGGSDYKEMVLDAVNRRGKKIKCRVICTPLTKKSGEINGAIILMEDIDAEIVS